MRVKICGVTRPGDARAAAGLGADYVGMILADSVRQVTVATARAICGVLPATTQPVLVFKDNVLDEVVAALAATGCQWVQLHGSEPVSYVRALATRWPQVRLIKGWEVRNAADGAALRDYLGRARAVGAPIVAVLLDAPKTGAHPGYECLAAVAESCRLRPPEVWLAGGLTVGNVAAALAAGGYDGVDVASGVESGPGVKDEDAMRRFIAAVRGL